MSESGSTAPSLPGSELKPCGYSVHTPEAKRVRIAISIDIDLVVAFTRPASFDDYMDLKLLLEDALERSVDLVTEAAILPRLKSRIDKEAIRVA